MTAARCPICRKPTESERNSDFPFCSERCRLLDLGNWASEKYRVSQPIFDESEFEGAGHDSPPSDGDNRDDRENDDARDRSR
ncbi:MAG: DNA gyrase inhibitor YacG [Candidatus Acidiferrales bacterium]